MKVVVYPFDRNFLPILECADLLNAVEIEQVVSLPGWGYAGLTIPTYGGIQYTVSCDLNSAMKNCDSLWIVDSWNQCSFAEYILPAVLCAKKKLKDVICTRKLSFQEKAILNDLLSDVNIRFVEDLTTLIPINVAELGLLGEITSPVIAIGGIIENTGKFDAQANLYRQFCREGYNVCWISSRTEAVLMGAHPIPSFMRNTELSEDKKILAFNKHVMLLEGREAPDLILMGLPGSLSLYNKKFSNDFGIFAQEMLQAVEPDVFVVGTPFSMQREDFSFERLGEFVKQKTGVPVDFYIMSSYTVNSQESELQRKLIFSTIDGELVAQKIRQISNNKLYHVDPLFDEDDFYSAITNELSGGEINMV